PGLIDLLEDKSEMVRRRAVMALAELGPEARLATSALIQSLKDPSALVRRWAIAALGAIGPKAPAAIPALIESLGDGDVKTRAVTAAALVKMGSRAVPRLLEALSHVDGHLRRYVVQILGKIGKGPDVEAALLARLQDGDADVAGAARAALERRGIWE